MNYISFQERKSKNPIVIDQVVLEKDDWSLQWIDTFALVPVNDTHSHVYFTTNRLQLYFAYTMDWSGNSGANMRLYRFTWAIV